MTDREILAELRAIRNAILAGFTNLGTGLAFFLLLIFLAVGPCRPSQSRPPSLGSYRKGEPIRLSIAPGGSLQENSRRRVFLPVKPPRAVQCSTAGGFHTWGSCRV
jgi:hypothetical protein